MQCEIGYYLNLRTYGCVASCPLNTIAIVSNDTYMGSGF